MNRNDAIAKLKTKGFDFESSILEMCIYPELIEGHLIEDVFGVKPFENNHEKGWFIWIDPCTIANWSHGCYYYFITENKMYEVSHGWMPNLDGMEKLN